MRRGRVEEGEEQARDLYMKRRGLKERARKVRKSQMKKSKYLCARGCAACSRVLLCVRTRACVRVRVRVRACACARAPSIASPRLRRRGVGPLLRRRHALTQLRPCGLSVAKLLLQLRNLCARRAAVGVSVGVSVAIGVPIGVGVFVAIRLRQRLSTRARLLRVDLLCRKVRRDFGRL
eukprot:6208594-Pleurochrysis_carterae.AAC.1